MPFSEPVRNGLGLSQPTLLNYGWPGNIRELRNMMERTALFLSVEPQPELNVDFYNSYYRNWPLLQTHHNHRHC